MARVTIKEVQGHINRLNQVIGELERGVLQLDTKPRIDSAARIDASCKRLSELVKTLGSEFKEFGLGTHKGELYSAVVYRMDRIILDVNSLKTSLPENLWRPFEKESSSICISYKPS